MRPKNQASPLDKFQLAIVGDNTNISIPVAADGSFTLPRDPKAADDDAQIVLNQNKGLLGKYFGWFPIVRTPGIADDKRRLGDMRLECEVQWAILKWDLPFYLKALMFPFGDPCRPTSTKMYYGMNVSKPGTKLKKVTLSFGDRRETPQRHAIPLEKDGWPDDTLVEFEFENPATPAGPAKADINNEPKR